MINTSLNNQWCDDIGAKLKVTFLNEYNIFNTNFGIKLKSQFDSYNNKSKKI